MSFEDSDERPAKKRRFFSDPDDESPPPSKAAPTAGLHLSSPGSNGFKSSSPAHHLDALALQEIENGTPGRPNVHEEFTPSDVGCTDAPLDDFVSVFEAFVGEKVAPDVISLIRKKSGDDVQRAVNIYLDGTWKKWKLEPPSQIPVRSGTSHAASASAKPPVVPSMPAARYVGAFGVEGWATRSGANLIKFGDTVNIERQKIVPPTGARPNSAAAKRVDVIVRFTDSRGSEIGRLAKETANWVSALLDSKMCKFEGKCVYAPDRLRTNDTIFLQLKCSLLKGAFVSRRFKVAENRATGLYEEKETSEERELRMRQVALVKLFSEINLLPTKANATAAKERREGLLSAAEMAEKKEKEASKAQANGNSGTSTPPEEAEEGEELEQDQLDSLYKKAQSFDFNTPEAEPADTFAMNLRPYQKQALHWMLAKEKDVKDKEKEVSMHPLWEEYEFPLKDMDDADLPQVEGQSKFYVNPYSGEMSLEFPAQELHCLGGILADEMGLGKTIQMLSLIHSHRSPVAIEARRNGNGIQSVVDLPRLNSTPKIVNAPCTTLVIAPMSLLAQWQSETEKASAEGTLKSMVYYGSEKNVNLQHLCSEANAASAPDVIITSYGVVLSEFTQISSKSNSEIAQRGLFSVKFFRIILDEAHNIKNRQSKTAKACYELAADHRWVLTGTPIVNRLEDLFSLVRFLRVEPWNNFSFWRTFITLPFESKNFMRALDVVQTVLEPLVMRRTKDMKMPNGEPLVPLPSKTIQIVEVELSQTERDVYDYVYHRAKRTFQDNMEAGTVMKAFTSIFAQILRLRQSCCHPILVRNQDIVADEVEASAAADAAAGLADDMDLQALIGRFTATTDDAADANTFGANVLAEIRDEAVNECPICAEEPMIEQTVTGCWHSACKKCLLDYIKHQTDRQELPRCFNCREPINQRDLFEVVRHDDDPSTAGQPPRISLQRLGVNDSSAKVVALTKALRDLRREHPKMKSVVFSQFTSFMSLIEPALTRANMHFLRLDGSMAQKARATVLEEFQQSDKFTVLLISLRAGGVGLNLTSAKRVFMMDPWWSFAVEAQAIDRVHRMGQEDEVFVYRFIVKGSVEERMLRIQDRKKFIATSLGMMSDEEKKLQRIEDIKDLLS